MCKKLPSNIPNKCDLCGLKAYRDQSTKEEAFSTEKYFAKLRRLQDWKIIPKGYPITIHAHVGSVNFSRAEFCSINHSMWDKRNKSCPSWMPNIGLSLGECLATHEAKKMGMLTRWIYYLTIIIAILTVISLFCK